ncbi:MAG: hypothetical protein U0165_15260 [Polyangiaceae bacterium]
MTPLVSTRRRWRIALLLTPFVLSNVAIMIGTAMGPVLLTQSPLLLVALSPLPRHLVLVPEADPIGFYVIGVIRLFVVDPFMYQLGREFGVDALVAVKRRYPDSARSLVLLERLFRRAGLVLVFFFSAPLVCLLAGASGVKPTTFVIVNLIGSVVFLWALRTVGAEFSDQLALFKTFLQQHILAATIVSIALVLPFVWKALRAKPHDNEHDPST